jgi:GTPase SAR1 family protein
MPLPVVVLAVAAGASAAGTWLTVRRVRRPMEIVVLGQHQTGKTVLINSWLGEWEETPGRTHTPVKIGTIKVDTGKKVLFVKKKFIFKKVKDISGRDASMMSIRGQAKVAKVVLYLINAMHLYEEELRPAGQAHADEWVRIVDDSIRIKRHCANAEHILLVVTHVDLDPRFERLDRAEYQALITNQLTGVITTIGNPARIQVKVGSLVPEDRATTLTSELVEAML